MNTRESNGCPAPRGILVIIGGKENKGQEPEGKSDDRNTRRLEILQHVIALSGKKDPQIEVISSASSAADESFDDYLNAFNKIGASRINHIHHKNRNQILEHDLHTRIMQADVLFFTGGDQLLLTGLYGGSAFLTALKNRYIEDEVVIAGTSAGAMALSTPMIYAGQKDAQQYGALIKVTTGLEFLKDVCIDTHFVDRGRFVRMAQVIMTNPTCIGLGIEEDTAIIVRNGVEGEVIGSGIIIVIEGFDIEQTNLSDFTEEQPISIRNLKVHLLGRGDHYKIPQVNPPHL
jgi:cyanophycinase